MLHLRRLPFVSFLVAAVFGGVQAVAAPATVASTQYSCANGERFMVEAHANHLRLRTGTGVFTLTNDSALSGASAHFTDGQNVLRAEGDAVLLERPGLPVAHDCRPEAG